jgi:hypothetical protein
VASGKSSSVLVPTAPRQSTLRVAFRAAPTQALHWRLIVSDNVRYRNGPEDEPWMLWKSALKLNYGNQQSIPNDFTRGERVSQTMQPDLMAKAALRGFRFVPQIVHLNFLSSENLFGAYPELAGRGDAALGGRYCESAMHQRAYGAWLSAVSLESEVQRRARALSAVSF